jgi:hypothetical protein
MTGAYVVRHFHPAPVFRTALDVGSAPGANWYIKRVGNDDRYSPCLRKVDLDVQKESKALYAVLCQRIPGLDLKISKYRQDGTYPQKKKEIASLVSDSNAYMHPTLTLIMFSFTQARRLLAGTSSGTSRTTAYAS